MKIMTAKLVIALGLGLALGQTALATEVDLKRTFPAEVSRVEDGLERLAQGNERSAEVTKAVLNAATGEVAVDVRVRSRHRVRGGPPWARYDVTAYDWTVSGTVRLNWRTGRVDGTVDLGRGVRVNVRDIANALAGTR